MHKLCLAASQIVAVWIRDVILFRATSCRARVSARNVDTTHPLFALPAQKKSAIVPATFQLATQCPSNALSTAKKTLLEIVLFLVWLHNIVRRCQETGKEYIINHMDETETYNSCGILFEATSNNFAFATHQFVQTIFYF